MFEFLAHRCRSSSSWRMSPEWGCDREVMTEEEPAISSFVKEEFFSELYRILQVREQRK